MKFKLFVIGMLGLMIAPHVGAQSNADVTYWSLLGLKFDKGVQEMTSKYDGLETVSILFNKELVQINLSKSTKCAPGIICQTQSLVATDLSIKLQVRKSVSEGCYDSYYASTPDDVKSEVYEQVIVNRFASERCQPIQKTQDGYVRFKVTGLSKSTLKEVSVNAYAVLLNVLVVKDASTIPEPQLPTK